MQAEAVAAVIAAYLAGSVDFGVILPRLRGVDIYAQGSGNPGATNVLRSMGRKWAALVVLGDLSKGFLSAMAGDLIGGDAVGFAAGFAAALGHCFPVWHRFRGGKGVAATGGVALWMEPLAGLGFMLAWAAIVGVARRASIASILVAASLAPLMALLGHEGWALAWAAATSVLVVGRHHGNIRRLVRGSEHRIEEKA